MLTDINTRAAILLFIMSIVTIGFHKVGGFEIEKNLLVATEHDGFGQLASDKVDIRLNTNSKAPKAECVISDTTGYNYCGFTIVFGETPEVGEDFSIYNNIELGIELNSPINNPKIRFSLRNYNNKYSKKNDDVSLKFNSVTYETNSYKDTIKIPLNAFQVDRWWVEQYTVGFDNALLDFSNISFAEFVTDTMDQKGTYKLTVHKAMLYGELLTEEDLLKIILFIWLLLIIVLITLQSNRLKRVSKTDSLTGLMNRRGLAYWVTKHLPSFSIGSPLTMFYLDLDDFKKINDSYGHLVGDELLCRFCDKITSILKVQSNIPQKYTFSRLSGDEFAIVFKGIDEQRAGQLAESLIAALEERVSLSSSDVKISMSLGIASSDPQTKSFESFMSKADSAMYHAKKRGKNQFKIFDESVSQEILFRKEVAEKICTALREGEFSLKYMPLYHASDLGIYGAEVLLRCNAKSLNNIGPDVFIPIAEEFGIIKDIDLWVIEATFKQIAANQPFIEQNNLVFGINISSVELHNRHFVRDVKKLMDKYKINSQYLEMEITETSLVETDELSISILEELQSMGIKLALDDFGTGYTAFSQLMHYPVDCLKIDKSFVDDLTSKTESRKTMIKAILSIAKAYRLKTVAEGIESTSQYHYLMQRGCDMLQGYLFSKPLDWQDFIAVVKEPSNKRVAKFKPEAEL